MRRLASFAVMAFMAAMLVAPTAWADSAHFIGIPCAPWQATVR